MSKEISNPDHQEGIISGVAFARSSLRRINPYASVVAPRRLASNAFLVISNTHSAAIYLVDNQNQMADLIF
jgi:hypothetical protein